MFETRRMTNSFAAAGLTGYDLSLLRMDYFLSVGVPKLDIVQHTSPNIVTEPVDLQMPLEVVASAHLLCQSSAGAAVILLEYL